MKMLDAIRFQEIYPEINQIKLPIQTAYKLSRIVSYISEQVEFYDQEISKILQEYGQKNEDGTLKISDDGTSIKIIDGKMKECSDKIIELQSIQIAEPSYKIDISELDGLSLTLEQMNILLPFIE